MTLRNEPIFEGPSAEWQRLVQGLPLSVAQRRVLIAHPQGFRNEDHRKLNEVDRDQAYREIQEMASLRLIQPPESHGAGAVYRLAPGLHEARAFLGTRVPRLRERLTAEVFIRNSDYRELFGVTRFAAARELRRLVREGYLKLEGERRGARYLPGPALKGPGKK